MCDLLSTPGVPSTLSIIPMSMLGSTYGVPLVMIVDLQVVPMSAYGNLRPFVLYLNQFYQLRIVF